MKNLRRLIVDCSKNIHDLEGLQETLKWGQPSYLPKKKHVGTTVRLHWSKNKPQQIGVYFHCQTQMIQKIRKKYGDLFKYDTRRAILFDTKDSIPKEELSDCIRMAFTYHFKKKK